MIVLNALEKARACIKLISEPKSVILAADTLVVTKDQVLGKPTNEEDIILMMHLLSGKTHQVITGFCLYSPFYGEYSEHVITAVSFRHLSKQEIRDYAKTKDPYGKSGSYAIQGLASLFVERINGSYTNIMGLPIESCLKALEKFTDISIYQWCMRF